MSDRLHTLRCRRAHPISLVAGMATLVLLAGCAASGEGRLFGLISPYRADVVQGNVVTQEMAAVLKPGLTRDQVRAVLGSPLLADAFHADRWDYVFTIRRQGTAPQQRRLSVFFEGDRLQRHEADPLPGEREFVASIDAAKVDRRATRLELTEAQIRALPAPRPTVATAPLSAASGPTRDYPPLEAPTPAPASR